VTYRRRISSRDCTEGPESSPRSHSTCVLFGACIDGWNTRFQCARAQFASLTAWKQDARASHHVLTAIGPSSMLIPSHPFHPPSLILLPSDLYILPHLHSLEINPPYSYFEESLWLQSFSVLDNSTSRFHEIPGRQLRNKRPAYTSDRGSRSRSESTCVMIFTLALGLSGG
jgi:hypothetical protein